MTLWAPRNLPTKKAPVTHLKKAFFQNEVSHLGAFLWPGFLRAFQQVSNSASCNRLIFGKNWAESLPLLIVYSCSPENRPGFRADFLWVCRRRGRSGWKRMSIWQYADLSGRHTVSLLPLCLYTTLCWHPWPRSAPPQLNVVTWNAALLPINEIAPFPSSSAVYSRNHRNPEVYRRAWSPYFSSSI